MNRYTKVINMMESYFTKDFEKAKRLSKKNWEDEYYLFYYDNPKVIFYTL